MDHPS
jgi:hypothetical protein